MYRWRGLYVRVSVDSGIWGLSIKGYNNYNI